MPKISPYSMEFEPKAVQLLWTSGRLVPAVGEGAGRAAGSLRYWARQRGVDEGKADA